MANVNDLNEFEGRWIVATGITSDEAHALTTSAVSLTGGVATPCREVRIQIPAQSSTTYTVTINDFTYSAENYEREIHMNISDASLVMVHASDASMTINYQIFTVV